MSLLTLIPAYGRKYATQDAMLRDWDNGKDFFIIEMGQYCSIRDEEAMFYQFDIKVLKMNLNSLRNHFVLKFIDEKEFI